MKRMRVVAQHPTDIRDAIQVAEALGETQLNPADFDIEYLGMLTADEFREYDDIDAWMDIEPGVLNTNEVDTILNEFRGYEWAGRSLEWVFENKIPPVIVVTAPDKDGRLFTVIGDGRGRVNLANGFDMAIPAYHLVHKAAR